MHLDPAAAERHLIALLRGSATAGPSPELTALAFHHGLGGPVALALDDAPALARHELAHRRGLHWLSRIAAPLQSSAVRFAVLKGLPLGERLYRPFYLRSSTDIDILIEPSHRAAAHAALQSSGYRAADSVAHAIQRTLGHDSTYLHPSGPPVELHDRLHLNFGVRPATRPLLDRAAPFQLSNGLSVLVLHPVDEFVHLASHAAAHRWDMQRWNYDLVLFLRRYPDLHWPAVHQRCLQLRLLSSVLATCSILRASWDVDVPLASFATSRYQAVAPVAARLRHAEWTGGYSRRAAILRDEMRLCDGPLESFRYARRVLLAPLMRRVLGG